MFLYACIHSFTHSLTRGSRRVEPTSNRSYNVIGEERKAVVIVPCPSRDDRFTHTGHEKGGDLDWPDYRKHFIQMIGEQYLMGQQARLG